MGTVYRARDRELGRDVALKVIRLPEGSPDVAARMLREARTLAQLEHPGIVPVHDVGTSPDGRAFYAMKLVRGSPLDALPASSVAERLRIVERICEAVAFAHAHGVIHRDLKPQNVMVGPFGEVLVMDWGVAKLTGVGGSSLGIAGAESGAARSASPTTGHGVVLGTPGYMAPEQAAGDPALVDARVDVYAIGAILRDLCADGESDDTSNAPNKPGKLNKPNKPGKPGKPTAAGAPRPLRAIIAKAMATDAANRYQDVTSLARDVAAFRAGEPVSAYRENLLERTQRIISRYRTPILLVLAYLVMRTALALFFGR
jgi:serine/threonine-protein kinase